MGANDWLVDQDYLNKTKFSDKYYLSTLCRHIKNFIQNIPVNVYVGFDESQHDRIYLNVGDSKKCLFLDRNIAYADFLTLMKSWLKKFYPQYACYINYKRKYTEDELIELKKEKEEAGEPFDLTEALSQLKEDKLFERGVIEKVYFPQGSFVLKVNNTRYLHKTETPNKKLPIRQFMVGLRDILKSGAPSTSVKNYIFESSDQIQILPDDGEIEISYSGQMMLNFIKLNHEHGDMYSKELVQCQDSELHYKWGERFSVFFESALLRDDCVNWLKEKKKQ